MKKILSVVIALLLILALPCVCEEAPAPHVFVSITDDTGNIALAYAPVPVTDTDADGVFSIADALMCAHIQYHELANDAFICENTDYGISLLKLWNIDNGGSFGYCLNDASALSLADPVQEGDHVKAYAYTDLDTWSDTYCYFSETALTAAPEAEIALTLYASGFDAAWAPITYPAAGAAITVNGEETAIVTDENGAFVLSFAQEGVYTVSAHSEAMTLVSPVLIITIAAE